MFFNIYLTTSFDPVAPNTSVTRWILDGPLVGGAYLAGEQSLFHAVPLHAGWTTCRSQAALGFVQPQLQLADPLQTPMEDNLTGAGLFLRGLGHRHNTPGSTPRAWALTLPEQNESWPSRRILPPCLSLLCSSHLWLQKPLPGVGSNPVTVSLFVTLAARPKAAGAELSRHTLTTSSSSCLQPLKLFSLILSEIILDVLLLSRGVLSDTCDLPLL